MGTPKPLSGPAPTPEEIDAFAALLIEEMRAQGVVGNIAHDRDNQRLINESLDAISVVGPIQAYAAAPEDQRADLVRRYIAAHIRGRQTIETWEEARDRVFPKVVSELEHVCMALRQGLEGWTFPTMPTAPVTEHLRLQFVWEIEDGTATVHAADVERWGVSLDDLQTAAAANLQKRTPAPMQWLGSPESPGVLRSSWHDGFDATRVVFSGDYGVPAKGPLVAVATSSSDLFLADSTDESALFQLGLAVQRAVKESPNMVWLWPLLLDGEERKHWLPPESSAAYAPLSVCAALHAQLVYNTHGGLLQRVLDANDSAVKVGGVNMVLSPEGAAATVAIWKDGAPAALARGDLVHFERDGERLGLAPWATVTSSLGSRLEPIPGYPERFRALEFPNEWEIAQMKLPGS